MLLWLFVGSVVLLIILQIRQIKQKDMVIYNVYTDDDDEFEKEIKKEDK
jgi:hypothetical protein